MTSTIACELPLYGTCSILTPAWRLKSSAAIWPVEPVPADRIGQLSGRAFASWTSSFTERTGSDGFTTSTIGTRQVSETPVKSFNGS